MFEPKPGSQRVVFTEDVTIKRLTRTATGPGSTEEFHIHPDDPTHCWLCGGELDPLKQATLSSVTLDGTPVMAFCHPACSGRSRRSLSPQ